MVVVGILTIWMTIRLLVDFHAALPTIQMLSNKLPTLPEIKPIAHAWLPPISSFMIEDKVSERGAYRD